MGGPRGAVAGRDLLTRIPNRGFGACVSSLSVRFAGHELRSEQEVAVCSRRLGVLPAARKGTDSADSRSEEHTSELQSPCNLVCRLLLEKKKKKLRHLSQ